MSDWLEAEQRVERAQQLSESHLWAEALTEIEAALAINPHNPIWHAHRGFLLEELDRWGDAVQAYESSIELDPGDRDVAIALGAALTRLGRFTRALEVFEDIAERFPDFEPAYCHRIGVYAELGRHDQAEEMFYLAQELDESCPHCFFHMGSSLAVRGQFARAIFCWRRVLELEPDYIGVNQRIAQAYRARGELEAAKEYYLREIREDAGNTDLLYELAEMILESGQVADAAGRFAQIIELDPEHVASHFALGKIHLIRGDPEAALHCFETIMSLEDGNADLPAFDAKVGEALLRLHRFPEARTRLRAAIARRGSDIHTLMLLGQCLLSMGKSGEAGDAFRRVLALDADNHRAHHGLALCLVRRGQTTTGLDHCLHALRVKPDYEPAMHTAISAYMHLGRWREARRMLRRAKRRDPDNSDLQRLDRRLWYYRLRHYWQWVISRFGPLFRRAGR